MQSAKQISVRLVNKPGKLATILSAMAKEKVDLWALTVMDASDRSTLRFVADDPELARSALEAMSVNYDVTDVLMVDVSRENGSFRKICERLAMEHLNIDYAYGSVFKKKGKAESMAIIKVNDLAKAQRVLSSAAANGRERKKPVRRRPAQTR